MLRVEYLPDDRVERARQALKRRIGYRVWKRKLCQQGGKDPARVLDIGCGAGYLLGCLEDWYDATVVGGDLNSGHVEFASNSAPRSSLAQFDGQRLPFEASSFDLVFAMQVVEHVPDPDALLAEVARVTTPEGLFVATTPNPTGLAANTLGDDWQGYKHDHVSLRAPSEWRESVEDAGFSVCSDGTTLLTGFPSLRRFPLALLSWVPLAFFGYFSWTGGESYKLLARRVDTP
jgi:SAM-dependent methyltransferase